jgi:hypothetical protein
MRSFVRLAVLVAWASAARAEPARLAVISLDAPPDLTFMGKSVADAVATEAARLGGFEVLGPDAVEQKLGRAATAALVRCADDARCLAQTGAKLGVDRVIAGWLQKVGDRYKVALVQVDMKSGARLASIAREVPIASRRLKPDVVAAAPALLGGKADQDGVLKVVADVSDAAVAIDDAPAGTAPITRTLKPGRHKVQVSKPGYAAAEPVWVEVPAGGAAEHKQRLYEIPARDRGNGGADPK